MFISLGLEYVRGSDGGTAPHSSEWMPGRGTHPPGVAERSTDYGITGSAVCERTTIVHKLSAAVLEQDGVAR